MSHCSGPIAINFFTLTFIRGTTPLMMYYGVTNLNSAGLVVALKCVITATLFLLSAFWQYSRDIEVRAGIKNSFRDKSIYWRLFVVGFLQSAVPYLLALYSLQYLPPTMVGVFIVTIPWWGILFERLPFINLRSSIPGIVKVGMFCGIVGIPLMLGPITKESIGCKSIGPITPAKRTNLSNNASAASQKKAMYDTCLAPTDLAIGVIALLLAPIFWGSASVFWKCNRRETHTLVQSVGQNLVGGAIGAIVWAISDHYHVHDKQEWSTTESITSIVFLGVATGWLATLLVKYLFTNIGARTTNQVLTGIPFIAFIEDSIFVKDVVKSQPYVIAMEIIGLLLVTGGVFVSNLPSSDDNEHNRRERRRSSLSEALLTEGNGSEGVQAGLNEAYENNVHEYEPVQQSVDPLETSETEEEINSASTDKKPYPKLTQVT